jgi:hypothetical protein
MTGVHRMNIYIMRWLFVPVYVMTEGGPIKNIYNQFLMRGFFRFHSVN